MMLWRGTEHWRQPSTLPAATAPQRVPVHHHCHHHSMLSRDLVHTREHTLMLSNPQDPIEQILSPCSVHPMEQQSSQALFQGLARLSRTIPKHSTGRTGW